MKIHILVYAFLFTAQILKAQKFDLEVYIYHDSTSINTNITEYKVFDLKELKKDEKFRGIPKEWSHIITFGYKSKTYQVPIDKSVQVIRIIDNPLASGYCNRLNYWKSADSVIISEHGNGCRFMNEAVLNTKKNYDPRTIIDDVIIYGMKIEPFIYKKQSKTSSKKK